jgi:hypothetical protein
VAASTKIKLKALWRHISISGGGFSSKGVFVQCNNKWVNIPCHNACEVHKHCSMKNRTLLPCSGKVGQSSAYSSAASSHSASWLWSKRNNKQITLLTFIFWSFLATMSAIWLQLTFTSILLNIHYMKCVLRRKSETKLH